MLLWTCYWSDMNQRHALVNMLLKWYRPVACSCEHATEVIRTSGMLLWTCYWSDMDQWHALVNMLLKWYGPVACSCEHATKVIQASGILLWTCYWTAGLYKRWGFSWLPKLLFTCKVWIFCSCVIKNTSLHGHEAASPGKQHIMFWRWHFPYK